MITNDTTFVTFFLILCLTLTSCISNTYIFTQMQRDKNLVEKFVGMKVKVRRENGELISGFFVEMRRDSTVIRLKKKQDSIITIANHEIDAIEIKEAENTAALAAIIFGLSIVILSGMGLANQF